jgi:hypothetical protein
MLLYNWLYLLLRRTQTCSVCPDSPRKKLFKEQAKTKAAVRDEFDREARQHGRGNAPDSISAHPGGLSRPFAAFQHFLKGMHSSSTVSVGHRDIDWHRPYGCCMLLSYFWHTHTRTYILLPILEVCLKKQSATLRVEQLWADGGLKKFHYRRSCLSPMRDPRRNSSLHPYYYTETELIL